MMTRKLLILEPDNYSPKAVSLYSKKYKVLKGGEDGKSNRAGVEVLCVRLSHYLGEEFLSSFSELRYLVSPTTGLNHIDLAYCQTKGIKVLSLKGEVEFLNRITATAELTMGLIFQVVRGISWGSESVIREGKWDRMSFMGRDLKNLSLGIIGLGRIGKKVSNYGKAFEMKVNIWDPNVELNEIQRYGEAVQSLESLFSESDVISLHANYSKENEDMIEDSHFKRLKRGSYFINTARGELVNERSLIEALESGLLKAAAVDVLRAEQREHCSQSPLVHFAKSHKNLIVTPHIGGCTSDSMESTEIFMADKLLNELKKEEI